MISCWPPEFPSLWRATAPWSDSPHSLMFFMFGRQRPVWNGKKPNCCLSEWRGRRRELPTPRTHSVYSPELQASGLTKGQENVESSVQRQAFGRPSRRSIKSHSLLSSPQLPQGSSAHLSYLFLPILLPQPSLGYDTSGWILPSQGQWLIAALSPAM